MVYPQDCFNKIWFGTLLKLLWMEAVVSKSDLNCPDQSQRPFRSKMFCTTFPTTYTCLFDTNQNVFIELCNIKADFTAPGEKYVFTGRRRNIECEPRRYQPFSLWSNVSSQCVYEKSACNDQGQIVHDNGSTTEDRTCRCDYTQGYSFVSKPRHICYCIPSQEDCSCYSAKCASQHVLNSDYRCIMMSTLNEHSFTCPKIVHARNVEKEIVTSIEAVPFVPLKLEKSIVKFLVLAIWVVVGILGFGIRVYFVITKYSRKVELNSIQTNNETEFSSDTSTVSEMSSSNIKLVASIDLGTTYSGYASSTVENFKKDPMNIRINPNWSSGYRSLYSMKTPTCVLLKKKGLDFEFVAIGYDAQNTYAELVIEKQSDDYLLFEKFKMNLYNNENISGDMVIEDIRGRKIAASKVFTHFLTEIMKPIISYYIGISFDEIQWVVTVPAIWSHKAKDFMRKCAEKSGIKADRLLIALESEAVSVYFQYLLSSQKAVSPMQLDSKYIVIDIGGGTVDITAHEKLQDGDLSELCKPTGDYLGGTKVDQEFFDVFQKIIGKEAMDAFCTDYPDSFNDFIREIEKFKENVFLAKRKSVYFPIALNSLNIICKKYTEKEFLELVDIPEYKTVISVTDGKISLVASFFIFLFTTVVSRIIKIVKDVLKELDPKEVKTFLVVGGLSQSKFVQSKLKESFPNVKIILPSNPEDANVAVVKGAVLYGHRPNFITSRITQYTYGRLITPLFDDRLHDPKKRETIDGIDRCKDVFEVLVEKNKSIEVGRTVRKEYKISKRKTKVIRIAVYITKKDKVFYVDEEGCTLFCELEVDISEAVNKERCVLVHFEFGSTEFQVQAVDKETGKQYQTQRTLK